MMDTEERQSDELERFDRKAGEALRRNEVQPPAGLLDRIERTLEAVPAPPAPRKRWRIAYTWATAGAAAAIAVLLLLALPTEVTRPDMPLAVTTVRPVTPPAAPAAPTTAAAPHDMAQPQPTETPRTSLPVSATPTPAVTTPAAPAESVPATPAASDTETSNTPSDNAPTAQQDTPEEADRAAQTLRARTDAYWDRLLAQDNGRNRSRRKPVSCALYAGNFGTGQANINPSDPTMAASDLFIHQQDDDGIAVATSLTDENGRPTAPSGLHIPEDISLQHRMPLSVGLSLAVPLTERLTIATGLTYSYLYSSAHQQFASSQVTATRELHYLGIPLGFTYTFYRKGNFNFYIQGYGMVEKAVACRETFRFATQQDRGEEIYPVAVRGVQWSLGVSTGVHYAFTDHIGLYLEPGADYYFRTTTQPENYRTIRPVSFSLRIGLRFGV